LRSRLRAVLAIIALGSWGPAGLVQNASPAEESPKPEDVRLVPQIGHSLSIWSAVFSPDERYILTGGEDGTAKLWETATGEEIRTFPGHSPCAFSAAFSPDGRSILTGSWGHSAKILDLRTGEEIREFKGHSHWVRSAAFSPDGRYVLTGSNDTTAKLWDAQTGAEIRTFSGHLKEVYSVAFSSDGRFVLTGSEDGTAKLWDVRTGAKLRTFRGHTEAVWAVVFSPDGRFVLSGSADGTAKLWGWETEEPIRSFPDPGLSSTVQSVAFSPDGHFVLAGCHDKTARLWDARTGAEIRTFCGHAYAVYSAAFSPDGRYVLTGSNDKTAKLWDARTGEEVRTFSGHADGLFSVAFSPDGRSLLTGSWGRTAAIWDAQAGAAIHTLRGHTDFVFSAAFSPDSRLALTGSWDGTARLWDVRTGGEVREPLKHPDGVRSVAFSPDGRFFATGSDDGTARIWEAKAKTDKSLRTSPPHANIVSSIAFSPDGLFLLTGSGDTTAKLWDAGSGALIREYPGHSDSVYSAVFSPDGRFVLTGAGDATARLWDAQTAAVIHTFPSRSESGNPWLLSFGGKPGSVLSVAFSPDGRYALTGCGPAKLWDTQTGAEVRTFSDGSDSVWPVAFSPDGRFVLTGSLDGMARLWDVRSGRKLCNLVSFNDGTWAVVDPEGRFDASAGGDVEWLHWVVGSEAISLGQLKERYYEPGLLAKLLGFNTEPLRDVEAFRDVKLFPEVEAKAPAAGSTLLEIDLADRGGGIGPVRVLVNGKEVADDARGGPRPDPTARSARITVDLAESAFIPGEKNTVEVIAWNAEGYLAGRGVTVDWIPPPRVAAPEREPELYAIVGGVSDYAARALRLNYAAHDARDMATALEVGAARLFGANRVHLTLLADTGDPKAIPPSRANFAAAFEKARSAKPWDVLVVYLSGHGIALGGGADMYAYLTREARGMELTDPALRRAAAITSEELTDWIKRIPALKQVMILDTCAAGAAAAKLVDRRAVPSSQVRAVERLKDRTGFHVLMGSAADGVSYEASQYGQGVLTYALLQGMRGAALREDEYVDVSRLFQYAADQVPELARNIGGIQRPQIAAPRGSSFDVGRMTGEDKPKVPLAMVRPLVLRPLLIDPQENDDSLNLSVELRRALEADSYLAARRKAKELKAVFVDADELPGAVRPTGTYTVQGLKVNVRLTLRRDGQKVATVEVEGSRDNLPALAAKLSQEIALALGSGAEQPK